MGEKDFLKKAQISIEDLSTLVSQNKIKIYANAFFSYAEYKELKKKSK